MWCNNTSTCKKISTEEELLYAQLTNKVSTPILEGVYGIYYKTLPTLLQKKVLKSSQKAFKKRFLKLKSFKHKRIEVHTPKRKLDFPIPYAGTK